MRCAIVGATATGKTRLAVALAQRLGGCEAISVDAMAVYRGLDIGTAKPSRVEQNALRWHGINCVAPSEEFSVAAFQRIALDAVDAIASAGRVPMLVGGTGLYHRAVLDALEIPPHDPARRARLERMAVEDLPALYDRLVHLDPLAASRIVPTNARRVVRALEVIEGTGRPFSSFGPGLGQYPPATWRIVGLRLERAALDVAITERLDAQLAAGFVDEVAGLLARPGGLSRTARQALGYREIIEHLGGRRRFAETRAEILRRTRRFARRQEAWFRRDPRILWFDAAADDLVDAVLAGIACATTPR